MSQNQNKIKFAKDILDGKYYYKPELNKKNPLKQLVDIAAEADDIIKTCNRVDKIDAYLKGVEGQFHDIDTYHPNGGTKMYTVNVARNHDGVDIEDFCDDMKLTLTKKRAVINEFSDNRIEDIWMWWIEEAQSDVLEFLSGKCCHESDKYYQELIEKILKNEKIAYLFVDELQSNFRKLLTVKRWWKKDKKERGYLKMLDIENAGFYGRGGKHFCINSVSDIWDSVDNARYYIKRFMNGDHNDYTSFIREIALYKNYDVDEDLDQIKEAVKELEAVKWILGWVEEYNNNLNFKEELKYRIDDWLADNFENSIYNSDVWAKNIVKGLNDRIVEKRSQTVIPFALLKDVDIALYSELHIVEVRQKYEKAFEEDELMFNITIGDIKFRCEIDINDESVNAYYGKYNQETEILIEG